MDELSVCDKILSHGYEEGADFVGIQVIQDNLRVIDLKNNHLFKALQAVDQGTIVRVLKHGSWTYSSSTGASRSAILKASEDAFRTARKKSAALKPISIAACNSVSDTVEVKVEKNPHHVDTETIVRFLLRLYQKIKSKSTRRKLAVSLRYFELTRKSCLMTSDGIVINMEIPRINIFAIALVGYRVVQKSWMVTGGFEHLEQFPIGDFATEIARKANDVARVVNVYPGRFMAILDPSLASLLIHEVIGHSIEADNVSISSRSFRRRMLDSRVANDEVTLVDDASIKKSPAFYPYDDEGVKTQKNVIIRKGVLACFLHNRETAYKFGTVSSGNARLQDHTGPPLVRLSNTYLDNGSWTIDEMTQNISLGVYLCGCITGRSDAESGYYLVKSERGFLIRNGNVEDKLGPVVIAGQIQDFLANIVGVGNDLEFFPMLCRKQGQAVPVSGGGPHLMIKDILCWGG